MNENSDNEFVYVPRTKTTKQLIIESNERAAKGVEGTLSRLTSDFVPSSAEYTSYVALVESAEKDITKPGEPLAEASGACVMRLIALLAMVVAGKTWKQIEKRTGISFLTADALKRRDKKGFSKLWTAAEAARDALDRERLRIAVVNRAVNGVDEAVIGRVGKDKDGQITDADGKGIFKTHYSDRLAEFVLSKLDKPTFGEDKTNINLGNQVIYNIQGLSLGCDGGDAMKLAEPGIPPRALKTGNKPATIEMPDFVELA